MHGHDIDAICAKWKAFGWHAIDLDGHDIAAIVNWGLARLRRTHADVLEAFYFDAKGVREIAADTGATERAVEGRLRRAREKLKQKLTRILRPGPPRPSTTQTRDGALKQRITP